MRVAATRKALKLLSALSRPSESKASLKEDGEDSGVFGPDAVWDLDLRGVGFVDFLPIQADDVF